MYASRRATASDRATPSVAAPRDVMCPRAGTCRLPAPPFPFPPVSSTAKRCLQCGTEYDGSTLFCPRDGSALKRVDPGSALIGQVVAERFFVLSELGRGGMGQVFLAEQVRIGRKCALKVIREGLIADPDAVLRFNREASNAASISHPNVVQVYDFGESRDGMIFLAMEFVEGESLAALLAREGALAPMRAVAITTQVASALSAAHERRIVHRDLKPDNVMLARNRDGSDLVKVVDFGVARVMDAPEQKVTGTGLVIGTPEYMSPEQFTGVGIDGRSDIYSLALIVFRMLAGTPAFDTSGAHEALDARFNRRPKRLAEANPAIDWPAGLQEILDRGLAVRAEERYQSVDAFAAAVVAVTSYWAPDVRDRSIAASAIPLPVPASATPGAVAFADPIGATAALAAGVRSSDASVAGAPVAREVPPPPTRVPTPAAAPGAVVSGPGGRVSDPYVATGGVQASTSSSTRGGLLWIGGLVVVVAAGAFALQGMRSGSESARTPDAAVTRAPAADSDVTRRMVADSSPALQAPPAATPDSARRPAAPAGDGVAGGAAVRRQTDPPSAPGAGAVEGEREATRQALARLARLTDSSATPAQAREALRLAGTLAPDTREGRVELKFRSLEANILLDRTTQVCAILAQLRAEAQGTRFERATSAYAEVARVSCP